MRANQEQSTGCGVWHERIKAKKKFLKKISNVGWHDIPVFSPESNYGLQPTMAQKIGSILGFGHPREEEKLQEMQE